MIEKGEECDDKNKEDGDGCDSKCKVEDGYICERVPSECFKGTVIVAPSKTAPNKLKNPDFTPDLTV